MCNNFVVLLLCSIIIFCIFSEWTLQHCPQYLSKQWEPWSHDGISGHGTQTEPQENSDAGENLLHKDLVQVKGITIQNWYLNSVRSLILLEWYNLYQTDWYAEDSIKLENTCHFGIGTLCVIIVRTCSDFYLFFMSKAKSGLAIVIHQDSVEKVRWYFYEVCSYL